jgi:hypothetical protein
VREMRLSVEFRDHRVAVLLCVLLLHGAHSAATVTKTGPGPPLPGQARTELRLADQRVTSDSLNTSMVPRPTAGLYPSRAL